MLDILYKTDEIKHYLRDRFCGPEIMPHAKEVRVGTFNKIEDDGYNVELSATFLPADFYTIKALDSTNSIGEPQKGFMLSTGSGELTTAVLICEKIADGMLDLD